MLIGDIVKANARRFKDKVALKDERSTLTFDEVNQRTNAAINALMSMGVRKGDKIAFLLYNNNEYSELLLGLPKAGFVIVPLNYRLIGRELKYMITNAEVNTIIYGDDFVETIEEIRPELDLVKNYIVVDHSGKANTEAANYEMMIQNASTSDVSVDIAESDLAFIMYTSGTTGVPKGVMLNHKNVLTNLYNLVFELQPKSDDILFNNPPLYHCAGQNHLMAHFFYGCLTITIKQFNPEIVLKTVQTEKPNVLHLVPAMQNMVINHPAVAKYDLSSIELMIYGASSIMRAHLLKVMEVFDCRFLQCAGQTEASPMLSMLRPEDHVVDGPEHMVRRLSSAGREPKLTEVRIIDADGNEVPPNIPGEEIARGDNVMSGYWKMPEATAETIVDGWLHTGDICIKDEYGFIYYVDRIKDMICRGGENVYPREIEEVISEHPDVLEVAVIGVPDQRLEEEIMALIVPIKGAALSEEDVIQICEKNLARYKKPRKIKFVDSLPKNPTGKVLKQALRKQYG